MTVTHFAPQLGGRRTNYFPGIGVNVRRKKHSEKRKLILAFGHTEDGGIGVHRQDGGRA